MKRILDRQKTIGILKKLTKKRQEMYDKKKYQLVLDIENKMCGIIDEYNYQNDDDYIDIFNYIEPQSLPIPK